MEAASAATSADDCCCKWLPLLLFMLPLADRTVASPAPLLPAPLLPAKAFRLVAEPEMELFCCERSWLLLFLWLDAIKLLLLSATPWGVGEVQPSDAAAMEGALLSRLGVLCG